MAICDWPQALRPREKLLRQGAASLSDAELLAIVLRCGTGGVSAVELAAQLLQEFAGLQSLLKASRTEFCNARGLGVAAYAQLHAGVEISRRCLQQSLQQRDVFASPADVRRYLLLQLGNVKQEVFAVLFLDNRHRLISFDKMFHGTIDGASVYPREVVRLALHHNAAAVIVAHNHPSGVAEPSRADEQITKRLVDALALVEVRVLDHMIVGEKVVSFAERGLL